MPPVGRQLVRLHAPRGKHRPSEDRSHRYRKNVNHRKETWFRGVRDSRATDSTVASSNRNWTPHHRTASGAHVSLPNDPVDPVQLTPPCRSRQRRSPSARPQFAVTITSSGIPSATERPKMAQGRPSATCGGCLVSDVPLRERINACQAIQRSDSYGPSAIGAGARCSCAAKYPGSPRFLERQAGGIHHASLRPFAEALANRRSKVAETSVRIARPRTFSPPNSAITAWRSSAIPASIIAPEWHMTSLPAAYYHQNWYSAHY